MECLVCGVPRNTEEMVKYVMMKEERNKMERISETVYTFLQYTIILSEEQVVYSSEAEEGGAFVRVVYPPDRSKSRKVLSRKVSRSRIDSVAEAEKILEAMGCANRRTREYSQRVYRCRESAVVIVQKDGRELVVVKTEERENGEALLEEVKGKLGIWVDLCVPPHELWFLLG